ncbi:hypothetical protein P8C59_006883 [Phyllachora maydis]|uniref:Microsomal glutathione S-transferase 3 n=1 Tax=Phyllachora maydis TaxID=1825666 RepID=A0AAD9I8E4_9PEZI|nr:hypothetical protein P8C59_006883 [Phyllachora maydis]
MAIITLAGDYGYVLLAVSSTYFVNFYHSLLTATARKGAGVQYPNAYASDELAAKDPKAFKFNCAQRAHGQFLEQLTPTVAVLLISGLRFPLASAGMGLGWTLSRILYARGYINNGPKGRELGAITSYLMSIGLALTSVYTGAMLVLEK